MDQKDKRIENRAWYIASIDRLMAEGVKLPPRAAGWLTQQRNKLYLDPALAPGGELRDRMRRLLIETRLEPRPALPKRFADRGVHASDEPRASSPAALQGSRAPTPMPGWLITGKGLPLRPPARRQAVSP